jgi:hypothetical protein
MSESAFDPKSLLLSERDAQRVQAAEAIGHLNQLALSPAFRWFLGRVEARRQEALKSLLEGPESGMVQSRHRVNAYQDILSLPERERQDLETFLLQDPTPPSLEAT